MRRLLTVENVGLAFASVTALLIVFLRSEGYL